MTIGKRLLKLRKERNLSQEELASALDVSRQTVSKWETDQSTPDFDKIIPICEFFNITSDELLTGKKEIKKEDINNNDKYAKNLSLSIILYIISFVILVFVTVMFSEPIIGFCLCLVVVAIATGLIIYNSIRYKKEKTEKEKIENKLLKQITSIVDTIGLIVYLLVSFLTGAWHITWIIFIVCGLLDAIVKLIFELKGVNTDEE